MKVPPSKDGLLRCCLGRDFSRTYNEGMVNGLTRITLDPNVMGGKPCIRGMRVTVGTVVGLLASGRSVREILEAYPYLQEPDISEALAYAAWRSEESEIPFANQS